MIKKTEPTIVSFYTDNWEYPDLANRMISDCQGLGLKFDIVRLSGKGDWLLNTAMKAGFILSMLHKYEHILWVDVDSKIEATPVICFNQIAPLLLRPHSTVHGRLWHVSVMGLKRTTETLSLCHDWKIMTSIKYEATDEYCFDLVIKKYPHIPVENLPNSYMALPHEHIANPTIRIGLSQDQSKMNRKYSKGIV